MNPDLPLNQRVDDLISQMTLDEKVSQMRDHAPAIPRLGVPKYDWWNEGLHGVAFAGYATNFPQVIGMAATWDAPLVHTMGETISTEARAKYNQAMRDNDHEMFFGLTFWAPNVNIFRDPRWGRGQETYGEDPFLTGRMAVAFVSGMQGDDPRYFRVVSTPKHYDVHSGPEPLRHKFNVDVTPHDLEDTYLPAFRAAVTEAHAQSVMCAYNAIDGAPACANTMLLRDHLRDDWHFDGYVVSDCAAIADIYTGHHFAPDMAHAAADALKAGTDLECGFGHGQAFASPCRCSSPESRHRGRYRHRAAPPLHCSLRTRHVRSAIQLCVRPNPLQRSQFAAASPAFAPGRARIHGPAQESGPHPPAQVHHCEHCRHRSHRRARSVAAGQLQRASA